jgi:hypothetical protein
MWGGNRIGAAAVNVAKITPAIDMTPGGRRPYIQPTSDQSPCNDEEALKIVCLPYPAAGGRL